MILVGLLCVLVGKREARVDQIKGENESTRVLDLDRRVRVRERRSK